LEQLPARRDSLVDRCVLSDDALVPPHASLYAPSRPRRRGGLFDQMAGCG
jgi:hypothetical protein